MKYEDLMKLALERGFYFPSCEIYADAQAGFWEYGPAGVSLKNKFLELWRRELVRRDRMLEIDGSQIMSQSVFEASGHLASFVDPITKCKNCKATFRADRLIAETVKVEIPESADLKDFDKIISEKNVKCPKCQGEFEIFCNPNKLNELDKFSEIKDTKIRVQIESESKIMTCQEAVDSGTISNKLVAYYLGILTEFYEKTGIDITRSRFRKLGEKEKAFYAEVAFDFEVETSIGWLELVACNYRSDYDLSNHAKKSKEKFEVIDDDQKVLPHVFEISMGIDRSLYSILEHSSRIDKENDRTVLSLKPYLAPIHVGVLSLVKKDGLKEKTDEIFMNIKTKFDAFLDHSGAIGRRYRRLDEVGAPLAVTIDHQTLEDNTVTVRERDSMSQD